MNADKKKGIEMDEKTTREMRKRYEELRRNTRFRDRPERQLVVRVLIVALTFVMIINAVILTSPPSGFPGFWRQFMYSAVIALLSVCVMIHVAALQIARNIRPVIELLETLLESNTEAADDNGSSSVGN